MSRVVLVLLGACLTACPSSYLEPRPEAAIAHRARTGDGWEVSLHQYKPVGPSRGRPVLLCHGISANDRNMDLDADHSLARWLAAQGREAWTLSLRGTGASDGIDPGQGRPGGYGLETFAEEDLKAAIRYVQKSSGASAIDYVGHSMGGMILYAYLSQGGEGIHAAVTLGSPTRLDWGGTFDPVLERIGAAVVDPKAPLPIIALAHSVMPLHGEIEGNPTELVLYNPKNVTPWTWKKLMAYAIDDISGTLALQMIGFIRTGRFTSSDGKIDYRADMARIRTPLLVVAGKLDRLAPPPAVRDAYRALGGPKTWWLLSEDHGVRHDYAHMDFILGEHAPVEVWRPMLDFLDRQGQPSAAGIP